MGERVGGRPCPLCGGRTEAEFAAREMMLGSREPFRYGECSSCGTLVLLDVPADLGRYYPEGYYSLRTARRRSGPIGRLRRLRGRAAAGGHRRLASILGGGSAPPWLEWFETAGTDRSTSICDVGCGSGALLFDLAGAGFERLLGVDPMIEGSLERDGVRIEKAGVAEIEGSFGLVMFNHSFEHLGEPLAQLRAARQLLAPGGTLLIRVPVAGSWAWRHYGADWVALDPPRHLFVPSPAGLRAAAEGAGLEIYTTAYDSTELQFWRSEQYRRDLGLFERGSHQLDPGGSPFSRSQLRRWRRRAAELNRAGDGDTAAFFLAGRGPVADHPAAGAGAR